MVRATINSSQYSLHPAWSQTPVRKDLYEYVAQTIFARVKPFSLKK